MEPSEPPLDPPLKRNAKYKCSSNTDSTTFAEATSGPTKLLQQLPASVYMVISLRKISKSFS